MLILAYDENDNIVHIKDAEKGKSYRCPDCGAEVRPRKGTKKTHHFFHMNAEDCGNSGESIVHKYYKELIASQKTVQHNGVEMIVTNSKIEQTLPNLLTGSHIIADVMLELGGYKWIAVEVCYKNHKDENHVDIYNALDMECFEVYVDMNDEKTDFEIKNYKIIASIKQYANKVNEKIKHELSLMTVGKQIEITNARHEERKKCYDEIEKLREESRDRLFLLQEINNITQRAMGYTLDTIAYEVIDFYGHTKNFLEMINYINWRIKDGKVDNIVIKVDDFDSNSDKYFWMNPKEQQEVISQGILKIDFYRNNTKIETLSIFSIISLYAKYVGKYYNGNDFKRILKKRYVTAYEFKNILYDQLCKCWNDKKITIYNS